MTDITGVKLTPGNNGDECLGNGKYVDENGKPIEICCEECDYALCCLPNACKICTLAVCIKAQDNITGI